MAVQVVVPGLGLGWSSGRITRWYCGDGASVQAGDPVFCLESEFVAVDVEADAGGVVRHRAPGREEFSAGEVVAFILEPGERLPDEDGAFEHGDSYANRFDRASRAPSSSHEPAAPKDEQDEEQPRILPLRRHSLPEAPAVTEDSSWAHVPGDDVAVPGPWEPQDEPQASEDEPDDEGGESWDYEPGEPPVKDPSEDPRPYFDIAPRAEDTPGFRDDDEPDWQPSSTWSSAPSEVDEAVEQPVAARVSALTLRVHVNLTEARKMRAQLAREWRTIEPTDEHVLMRAAALALAEFGVDDTVVLTSPSGTEAAVPGGSQLGFRGYVEKASAAPEVDAGFPLVSFASVGLDEGQPEISDAHPFALSAGVARDWAVAEDGRVVPVPMVTLTLAYDPARVALADAAPFLARIRDLIEAPYALLAA